MESIIGTKVLYDACVLYPAPMRDLLMHLAVSGLFHAKWTDRIHDEWIENLLRNRTDLSRERLQRTRRLMDSKAREPLNYGLRRFNSHLELAGCKRPTRFSCGNSCRGFDHCYTKSFWFPQIGFAPLRNRSVISGCFCYAVNTFFARFSGKGFERHSRATSELAKSPQIGIGLYGNHVTARIKAIRKVSARTSRGNMSETMLFHRQANFRQEWG